MKDEIEKIKSYYPNGQIESECSFKNGIPHGKHQHWHENGVLAREWNFKNGIPDGVGNQWDLNGNLIVNYEIVNGTGVQKMWVEAQQFFVENTWHNGRMTGRTRIYLKNGTVINEGYQFQGQMVSRKKYLEECKKDTTFPRYAKECDKPKKTKRNDQLIDTVEASENSKLHIDEEGFVSELLASKDIQEALSWLTESNVPERSLGEAQEREASIALVKSLYQLGAKKVWVFDIDDYGDEGQNSGKLIIELPDDPTKRLRLFKKCGDIANSLGYDAEIDTNQEAIFLMLD